MKIGTAGGTARSAAGPRYGARRFTRSLPSQTCPDRKGLFSARKSCSRYRPNTQLSSMDLTYKIIGADTHEYGPVSLLELKKWVSEGRITGATQVSRSDQEGWSTAGSFPELGVRDSTGPALTATSSAAD